MLPALRIFATWGFVPKGGMSMKRWHLAALAIVALGTTATPVHAGPDALAALLTWPGYTVWPPGTMFQQQIFSGYKAHWYQQQVPTVVPRVTYKLETTPVRSYVYKPKEVEEVQRQVTYVPVARIVKQEVTTLMMVPFIISGPSNLPIVLCRPDIRTHTLERTVHDMQPVVKEYRVKSIKMVPQETVTTYQQIVPVVTYDQQLTTEWQPTFVPYQHLQTVPVFDPHHAPHLFWP
jgi:hypothetical protein